MPTKLWYFLPKSSFGGMLAACFFEKMPVCFLSVFFAYSIDNLLKK